MASETAGKPITCLAAVAWKPATKLEVVEVVVAAPGPKEVRIKVTSSGVCGTDGFNLSGDDPESAFPVILGHEGCGIVESVGSEVKSIEVGDTVVPLYIPQCEECKFCNSGEGKKRTNLCQKLRSTQGKGLMPDGTTRFTSKDGKPIYHFMGTSTFSQYTVLPEIACAKVDPKVDHDKAGLLGCGITTGIGAARTHVEEGDTVAVFGLGAVGLSVVQGAKLAGASRIIAVDMNPAKFELAKKYGATDTISPKEIDCPTEDKIVELTDGGVDYSYECIGNVEVMGSALRSAHKGWGTSVVIGVAGAGKEVHARPFLLVTGRRWTGSAFGGVRGRTELPGIVKEYMDGKLDLDDMHTHTLPLSKINDAFDLMNKGESIRAVIRLFE